MWNLSGLSASGAERPGGFQVVRPAWSGVWAGVMPVDNATRFRRESAAGRSLLLFCLAIAALLTRQDRAKRQGQSVSRAAGSWKNPGKNLFLMGFRKGRLHGSQQNRDVGQHCQTENWSKRYKTGMFANLAMLAKQIRKNAFGCPSRMNVSEACLKSPCWSW